jgi:nucleoside-diphosphate-sugar epimerase
MATTVVFGLGYIGAELVRQLLTAGRRVVGLDNGFNTPRVVWDGLKGLGDFEVVVGDVADAGTVASVFRAAGPVDVVFFTAAQASAHPEAAPWAYTERTNITGFRTALDLAVEAGARRFVYASSIKVHGSRLPARLRPETPYRWPGDPVHWTQAFNEGLLRDRAGRGGLRAVAVRLGIVYGVGPVMRTDPRFMTVVNRFCLAAVRGEVLTVHPQAVGYQAFIHLRDAVLGLVRAAELPAGAPFTAVPLASGFFTVTQVARAVKRAAARRGLRVVVVGRAPPAWGRRPRFDPAAGRLLPERPISLADGIEELLDYWLGSRAG